MIDEAIKLLRTLSLASRDFEIEKDRKAIQLGIEALERHKELIELDYRITRDFLMSKARKPLPSEGEK